MHDTTQHKNSYAYRTAFTLVELMTVAAIIGIIVAVSIPVYKTFTVRSKVATVLPVIDDFKQQITDYYYAKGIFPNASDLGLGSGFIVNNPTSYSPYLLEIHVFNNFNPSGCPGGLVFVLSGAQLGITANNAWGYGGTSNSIAWLVWLNRVGDTLETICGVRMNNFEDMKYLPQECQKRNPIAVCDS